MIREKWKALGFPGIFEVENKTQLRSFCSQCSEHTCKEKCVFQTQKSTRKSLGGDQAFKVCLVGKSHSVHIAYSLQQLHLGRWFFLIPKKFPEDITNDFFVQSHQKYGCTSFVIGIGQWPASWVPDIPYSFLRYRDGMARIIRTVASANSEIHNTTFRYFFRSMHYLPIGDTVSSCPPTDWRSPPVIDAYNYLVQNLILLPSNKNNTFFLDTEFISNPMWDIAYDWCHLPRQVADVEALYIASVTLLDT